MDGPRVLNVLHIGSAFDPGLLHRLAQVIGVHKLARLLEAVPIVEHDDISGITDIMKNAEPGFTGMLAEVEVRIECLLPTAVIRNLVADQNMNHESTLQIKIVSSKIRNLQPNVNPEVQLISVTTGIDSNASEVLRVHPAMDNLRLSS
jgi:hypothetical protein